VIVDDDDDDFGLYDYFVPRRARRRDKRSTMFYPGLYTSDYVDSNEAFLVSYVFLADRTG